MFPKEEEQHLFGLIKSIFLGQLVLGEDVLNRIFWVCKEPQTNAFIYVKVCACVCPLVGMCNTFVRFSLKTQLEGKVQVTRAMYSCITHWNGPYTASCAPALIYAWQYCKQKENWPCDSDACLDQKQPCYFHIRRMRWKTLKFRKCTELCRITLSCKCQLTKQTSK